MLTQVRGANGCTYCRSDLDPVKNTLAEPDVQSNSAADQGANKHTIARTNISTLDASHAGSVKSTLTSP